MGRSLKNLMPYARDGLGMIGIAAITYGTGLIYRPAGFIVGGLFAVIAVVVLSFLDQKAGT